jgi:glyoxylate reductase
VWQDELPPSHGELYGLVDGAAGILCLLSDRVDEGVMEAAGSNLKVICNYAVGYDNIDLAAAHRRNIRVGNTPDVLTETTADLAFALLLSVARRIVEGHAYVQAGRWQTWGPELLRGYELSGKTLGIIGFGRIGKAVARRGTGFNMKTLFYSPSAEQEFFDEYNASKVDLDTVLRESDFLSLHCPLNEASMHIINREVLMKMKKTAILINTARGKVVVHDDLVEALNKGWIAGAGLDVTDPEPINNDSPLLAMPNVIITPHVGSATYETRSRMAEMCAENILAGLDESPLPYPVV